MGIQSSQLSLGCNEKLHLGGDFWIFALHSERRYWKTSSRSISQFQNIPINKIKKIITKWL